MYTDTILFIVRSCCALAALSFIIYLILSYKHSKVYRSVLQQETEFFDALSTTVLLSSNAADSSRAHNSAMQPAVESAASADSTILMTKDNTTELLHESPADADIIDFDASALEWRYILKK